MSKFSSRWLIQLFLSITSPTVYELMWSSNVLIIKLFSAAPCFSPLTYCQYAKAFGSGVMGRIFGPDPSCAARFCSRRGHDAACGACLAPQTALEAYSRSQSGPGGPGCHIPSKSSFLNGGEGKWNHASTFAGRKRPWIGCKGGQS